MSNSPTTPMIGTDGSIADVPWEQAQEEVGKGAKLAMDMVSPDGKSTAVVPFENVHMEMQKGAMLKPPGLPPYTLPSFNAGIDTPLGTLKTAPTTPGTTSGQTERTRLFIPGVGYTEAEVPKGTTEQYQARYQEGLQKGEKGAAVTGLAAGIPIAGGIASTAAGGGLIGLGASSATQGALSAGLAAGTGEGKGGTITAGVLGSLFPWLRGPAALKEAAGEAFADLGEQMGQHTVDASGPGQKAMEIADLPVKTPDVVNHFLDRTTQKNAPPLTYNEAREYIKYATAEMKQASSELQPEYQKFIGALKDATKEAADKAGNLQQYQKTMSQWATAQQVSKTVDTLKKVGLDQLKRTVPNAVTWLAIRDALKPWW